MPPTTSFEGYIKVVFYFNKNPNLSHEEFYEYWANTHSVVNCGVKGWPGSGVKKYIQSHSTPELKVQARAGLQLEQLEWDGATEFYISADQWDDFTRFMKSDDFTNVLGPDSAKFACTPVKIMISKEIVVEDVASGKLCRGS